MFIYFTSKLDLRYTAINPEKTDDSLEYIIYDEFCPENAQPLLI